jgi:hypothetical protein
MCIIPQNGSRFFSSAAAGFDAAASPAREMLRSAPSTIVPPSRFTFEERALGYLMGRRQRHLPEQALDQLPQALDQLPATTSAE